MVHVLLIGLNEYILQKLAMRHTPSPHGTTHGDNMILLVLSYCRSWCLSQQNGTV